MLYAIIILAACAFVLSFLLTPLVRDLALRRGWVDQPDSTRKTHSIPIPRLGGVSLFAATGGALGILWLAQGHGAIPARSGWFAAGAVACIFAVGVLDDFSALKPWQKLAGEIAAAALLCGAGVQIQHAGGLVFPPWLAVPITVTWLVGCTNAFNLIDGADGLAAGLGWIGCIAVFSAGLIFRDPAMVLASAALAGALAGILRFNFNPASMFLGDCGSLFIGFVLAGCAVMWSQRAANLGAALAPAVAFAVPLFDTAISIVRRFLRRQPIFSADRDHIHHRLVDRGFSVRELAVLLYCAATVVSAMALVATTAKPPGQIATLAVFGGLNFLAIQYLRYREFGLAVRAFRQNGVRTAVHAHFSLLRCEEALKGAATLDECWEIVSRACREFGFSDVILSARGRSFREQLHREIDGHWTLHVPLSRSEYIRFACPFEVSSAPKVAGLLADTLHRALLAKLRELGAGIDYYAHAGELRAKRRLRTRAIAARAGAAEQPFPDPVRAGKRP